MPLVHGRALETWESPLHQTRSWPVTRLANWSLTLLLTLSVLAPAAAGGDLVTWIELMLPAAAIALVARSLFEVVGLNPASRGVGGHAMDALAPALVATALSFGICKVIGDPLTSPACATTAVLVTIALTAAGALRGVEIRFRQQMRRVYFIGRAESLAELAHELEMHGDRQLVGFKMFDQGASSPGLASVAPAVRAAGATVLVLDTGALGDTALAAELDLAGVSTCDLVDYYETEFKKVPLGALPATWFAFQGEPAPDRRLRRLLEVMLAAGLLVLSLPALLAVAAAIRISSRGPALYRQKRVGKDGKVFTLLKLRSMAGSDGEARWAHAQAHRVTWLGRHLRRFRFDEVPQFWNVLRGDLALVGPRPEQVPIVERLTDELPFYDARHTVRPGITGWAQVNGGYGGSVDGTLLKLQRDLYYVKHASLRLDALIVWLTLKAVLAGRG